RTSGNYAGTDTVLPRGGRRVVLHPSGLRYPPHGASRLHGFAAARENPATPQEENARHKARKTGAHPCRRPVCFLSAWRRPVTVPVPPLRVRSNRSFSVPGLGAF